MDPTTARALEITSAFLKEMHVTRTLPEITPNADFQHSLGIGSIEKAELFHRYEHAFNVQFTSTDIQTIKTIAKLTQHIEHAVSDPFPLKSTMPLETSEPAKANPESANTLIDVIRTYAEHDPHRIHIRLLDENNQETPVDYGTLYHEAQKLSQGLLAFGLRPQQTVAVMLPTSLDFFIAFLGILLAGGIPVPIYPPVRMDQLHEYAKHEANILSNAGASILITIEEAKPIGALLKNYVPTLVHVTTVNACQQEITMSRHTAITANDGGLIQYTSGSTGNPKGVYLTHANLLANIRAYGKAAQIVPTDIVVSWLPLYHDMGLIGAWMGSLYHGIPLILMSPLTFLARPERWLWAIHYYRATLSGGPNFAYELCLKKVDDAQLQGLDLHSWRSALNGAEAVLPKTIKNFTKRFSKFGFSETTFLPCYGLAESTVALTFSEPNAPPHFDKIDRYLLQTQQRATPAEPNDKNALTFVSCGKPLPEHNIRIVDEDNQLLDDRTVGLIEFKGPSSMKAYYNNPRATRAVKDNDWFRTGDLGYLADGELYITGREKDLILKAGHNYYPEDIESALGDIKGLRKGNIIAFGVNDKSIGTEKIILAAETQTLTKSKKRALEAKINERMSHRIGTPPDDILLMPPNTIPKTSSGKLQRSEIKKRYLNKTLFKSSRFSLRESLQMAFSYLKIHALSIFKPIALCFYTIYVFLLLIILGPMSWIITQCLPTHYAYTFLHNAARIFLTIIGCPIKVINIDTLKEMNYPVIILSNHASFIDAIVYIAAFKQPISMIGKKELLKVPFLNSLMKKLHFPTLDREDFSKSVLALKTLQNKLQQGGRLLFFPEGTFTAIPGVRPFKLGAFTLSAKTKAAIIPASLKGTRERLRANSFVCCPGQITITFHPPFSLIDNHFETMIESRNIARERIASASGEQMIDVIE